MALGDCTTHVDQSEMVVPVKSGDIKVIFLYAHSSDASMEDVGVGRGPLRQYDALQVIQEPKNAGQGYRESQSAVGS